MHLLLNCNKPSKYTEICRRGGEDDKDPEIQLDFGPVVAPPCFACVDDLFCSHFGRNVRGWVWCVSGVRGGAQRSRAEDGGSEWRGEGGMCFGVAQDDGRCSRAFSAFRLASDAPAWRRRCVRVASRYSEMIVDRVDIIALGSAQLPNERKRECSVCRTEMKIVLWYLDTPLGVLDVLCDWLVILAAGC